MRVRSLWVGAVLGVVCAVQGCAAEPPRTFYDDGDAADGTADDSTSGADGDIDTLGSDASADARETSADGADAPVDGATDSPNDADADRAADSAGDAGPDAAGDANPDALGGGDTGCGPTNTISNCAACGMACDTVHSVGASCNGVSCSYSGCVSGWGDCVTTGAPNTDGCETPLNTLSNCTGCGLTCDSVHSLGRSCDGGTCGYTGCAPGYKDCITTGPPNADGCETPLNTLTDCTDCGLACETSHSASPKCTATGCTYMGCTSGWSNCNSAAPDTNGCECNTPGCCGNLCQFTHDNGVGNPSYDCVTPGTWTQAQATSACTAYTGDASQCLQVSCQSASEGPLICSNGDATKNCVCWSYGGNDIGHVFNGGGFPGPMLQNCFCPATTDPTWN
jgi:hypothetical protein